MLLVQAGNSLTDVLRFFSMLWLQGELGSCLLGCLMQLEQQFVFAVTNGVSCRNGNCDAFFGPESFSLPILVPCFASIEQETNDTAGNQGCSN